jgi:hypothetical protein
MLSVAYWVTDLFSAETLEDPYGLLLASRSHFLMIDSAALVVAAVVEEEVLVDFHSFWVLDDQSS